MITEEEYREMMRRVTELTALDPEEDTDEGRELLTLVDAIQEYERENFPEFFPRDAKGPPA